MRNRRSGSAPNRSAASIGSMAVPSDLLIRWPRKVMNPWPNTCRGSGSPALISIAGQMTVVKSRDVLADDVQIGRPPLLEQRVVASQADGRCVVDQGVEPDIHDARRIERQRNAPRLTGAADRDVLEAAFEQTQNLVAPLVRLQERRMVGEMFRAAAADTSTGGRSSSSRGSIGASSSDGADTCRRRDPSPA